MPVGRFRSDPRELDADERAVAARQYPEGCHAIGSLLGLSVPFVVETLVPAAPALLRSPLAAILGLLVGGIGGYLLGEAYRRRALEQLKADRSRPHDPDDPAGGA
jgi:multisubunit Na+/H+ antiporter MnhG subunit